MNLQFNIEARIEARNDKNQLIWCHSLFAPKVSNEFISELYAIL